MLRNFQKGPYLTFIAGTAPKKCNCGDNDGEIIRIVMSSRCRIFAPAARLIFYDLGSRGMRCFYGR
jgi:hypothetical protein